MIISLIVAALSLTGAIAGDAQSLSAKDFEEAKHLYVSKCSRCHKFYDPSAYSDSEWQDWMEKMRKKSKLKPRQYDLVLQYTQGLRDKTGENAH